MKPPVRWVVVIALAAFTILLDGAERSIFSNGRWVDLSHEFSTDTIYWPTASNFVLESEHHGPTPAGYFYAANRYRASEHGGTHLDAPIHFADGHQSVDKIPLDHLTGLCNVIDVSDRALKNPDYQIVTGDLKEWETTHGKIDRNTILLLRTGYSRHWPDAQKYLGTAEKGADAVPKLHFPGLHPDAARWLTSERSIKAIGLDTASIDFGQSKLFESHRILFEKDIPAFENLTMLEALPAKGAYVVALPMKIKEGTGAPLRIVAWVPKER